MEVFTNAFRYLRAHGIVQTVKRAVEILERIVFRIFVGRVIELRGNKVQLDGCTFLLDHFAIPTREKSAFFWNTYEQDMRVPLKKYIHRDAPVVELGASIGVVSCITNRMLTDPSQHVVVEANPDIVPILEKHKAVNNCGFTIQHGAIAYGSPTIRFFQHGKFLASSVHVESDRFVEVSTLSLKNILEQTGFTHINLLVDIECAEIELVRHEIDVIAQHVDMLFLETHPGDTSPEDIQKMRDALEAHGFVEIEYRDAVLVYEKRS